VLVAVAAALVAAWSLRHSRTAPPVRITAIPAAPPEARAGNPASPDARWDADWRRGAERPGRAKENPADVPAVAAADWLALHPADRQAAVTAALQAAAARSSAEAVRAAIRFCDEDPAYSLEHGRALIAVLAGTGDYRAALRFVLAEEAEGGLGENGSKWLGALFTRWSQVAPAAAAAVAQSEVGPGLRGEALQTIAAAWVKSNPTALADFAWQLPPSPARDDLWQTALRRWTEDDPGAARAWLSRRNPAGTWSARN
jgi:hypothetical protein